MFHVQADDHTWVSLEQGERMAQVQGIESFQLTSSHRNWDPEH